jgi:putative ABC transport system substrate-binding protein
LTGKWLELLREAAPSTRRVAVLWDSTAGGDQLHAIKAPATLLRMELQVLEVRSARDYNRVLTSAPIGRPQALVQLSSPQSRQVSKRVAEFALKNRLPAISMFRRFADAGGLMGYGPNLAVFFRRSATYVHRILQGANPADLPVKQPTKLELLINLKTAKALGLTIPPSVIGASQLREAYARIRDLERLLGRKQMEIEILEAARDVVKKSPWLRKGSGR